LSGKIKLKLILLHKEHDIPSREAWCSHVSHW